jgi:hypothetical protein
MFADLCPENWKTSGNLDPKSLAWQLICGSDNSDSNPDNYSEEYDIDSNLTAQKIKLLIDADSSQHSALVDISEGKNVVIEGPPGTGKSQTITNAIATAIHQGKTVLFVAEKLAALEVVFSKLQQIGLGDFCLQLHSDKTSSSSVIDSIRSRMQTTFDKPVEITEVQKRLSSVCSELQELANSTGKRLGPNQIPLYEILWRINELEDKNTRLFSIPEWKWDIGSEAYRRQLSLLMTLAASTDAFNDPLKSPWWNFRPKSADRACIAKVTSLIGSLRQALQRRDLALASLTEDFAKLNIDWLSIAYARPSIPEARETFFAQLDPAFVRYLIPHSTGDSKGAPRDQIRGFISHYNNLRMVFSFDWIKDASPLRELSDSLKFLCQLKNGESLLYSELGELTVWLQQFLDSLDAIKAISHEITEIAPFRIESLDDFKLAIGRLEHFQGLSPLRGATLTPSLFARNVNPLIQRGSELARSLRNDQARLERCFYMNRLPSASVIEATVQAIRPHCSNLLRLLDGGYNAAMKTLSQFSRQGDAYWPSEWVAALDLLLSHPKDISYFKYSTEFCTTFGELFQGIDTDWKTIEEVHRWCQKASESGLSPAEICQIYQTTKIYEFNVERAKSLLLRIKNLVDSRFYPKIFGLSQHNVWKQNTSELMSHANLAFENCPSPKLLGKLGNIDSLSTIKEVCDAATYAIHLRTRLETNTILGDRDISLGKLANGLGTDLDVINWHLDLAEFFSSLQLSDNSIRNVLSSDAKQNVSRLLQGVCELTMALNSWDQGFHELSQLGEPVHNWLADARDPEQSQLLRNQLSALSDCVDDIPSMGSFAEMMAECKGAGLERISEAVVKAEIFSQDIPDSFELSVLTAVANREIISSPSLRTFNRSRTEVLRQEYRDLDKKLFELNRVLVAHEVDLFKRKAKAGIAGGRVSGFTEMGLIKHELAKKARFRKVRDLLQKAPVSLQAYKPCFMMSPLSIAQFSPPNAIRFDLLIIDEASQIKPEDALGAILRANQVVVVGDPKQLPPTSFFERNFEEIDDEDALGVDHSESILEVASRVFYPLRRLRWHYRSQHESLIHFSNEKFYHGDLIVFPSPTRNHGTLGHYFKFIENGYFSGGCNPVEAKVVAKEVIKHALEFPKESLGVGTFNHKQSQLILEMIDEECRSNRLAREAIEKLSSGKEPLFVKNLENLQGDERDRILISYTYGPDRSSGRVLNRFGPINSDNGWRRLNVLVTRARCRSLVFASFKFSDIIIGPNASKGLLAFKDYLEYSQSGKLPERAITGRLPQSGFEISVAKVVSSLGCHAEPQVGVAGYYIDIGVQILDGSGDFILGIECDGASYHSSKSARDRDRLREEVIVSRGWSLHRIWSTDWFQNREREEMRLADAIKSAMLIRKNRQR